MKTKKFYLTVDEFTKITSFKYDNKIIFECEFKSKIEDEYLRQHVLRQKIAEFISGIYHLEIDILTKSLMSFLIDERPVFSKGGDLMYFGYEKLTKNDFTVDLKLILNKNGSFNRIIW